MEVRLSSEGAPGVAGNEDYAIAAGDLVGVFDGVTRPANLDDGCDHSPAWYVRGLASELVRAYAAEPDSSLPQLLASAISGVRNRHGGSCDLDHPGTPAATSCLVKVSGENLEYLVLCDSPLVLDFGSEIEIVNDDRFSRIVARIRETALVPGNIGGEDHEERIRWAARQRWRYINRSEGYWIAAAKPEAAFHAITGTVPLGGARPLRRAALLTDGASSAVEQFQLLNWAELLDVLQTGGPAELIRRVRAAERADRDGQQQPRYKRHDDATAAICLFQEDR